MGFSVLITYSGILYLNYDDIPNIVPTHINYAGEIDGWGSKSSLWIAICVNVFLLLLIWFVIKFPKYWNVPFEVKEENKKKFIMKFRLILAILSILISIAFSTMIFNAMSYGFLTVTKILFFVLVGPMVFLVVFNNIKTSNK